MKTEMFGMPIWLLAPAFLVLWIALGWGAKKALFAWLQMLTRRTETKIDDILIAAARLPLTYLIVSSGIAIVSHYLLVQVTLTPDFSKYSSYAMKGITILSILLFLDGLAEGSVDLWSETSGMLRGSRGFIVAVARVIIYSIGFLVMLDSFGVSVTPIIASLGIGSLAVALALQPTFENIFSGFQIILDRPVMPGHFIRLESGEEGFVEKVGWRTTWVRQVNNSMVIIPNKQLVNARVLNFDYPSRETSVPVEVGVHYSSDLERVERVAVEVAREVMGRVPGAAKSFDPVVRFHTFGASSINFTVTLRVLEFVEGGLLRHEFVKALAARFDREKIVMPFPIIALNTSQEAATLRALEN